MPLNRKGFPSGLRRAAHAACNRSWREQEFEGVLKPKHLMVSIGPSLFAI
jgi:hypothetical protein